MKWIERTSWSLVIVLFVIVGDCRRVLGMHTRGSVGCAEEGRKLHMLRVRRALNRYDYSPCGLSLEGCEFGD